MHTGAQGLNVAFRPPLHWQATEARMAELMPVFQR